LSRLALALGRTKNVPEETLKLNVKFEVFRVVGLVILPDSGIWRLVFG